MGKLVLSSLPKTWILDLDGTLVVHNGHLNGKDVLLNGVKEFFNEINCNDYILIITARTEEYKEETIEFLKENNIRYNDILFNYPTGERVLINDSKPSGLKMSYGVDKKRDEKLDINFEINEDL